MKPGQPLGEEKKVERNRYKYLLLADLQIQKIVFSGGEGKIL